MAEAPLVHVVDDDAGVRDLLDLPAGVGGIRGAGLRFRRGLPAGGSDRTAGCVLTDVRMPDLDGLALQRRLTALGVPPAVIVMTGHGDVPIAVEALKAGAADFLEKPFDDERLLAVVRAAADRQPACADAGRGRGRDRRRASPA